MIRNMGTSMEVEGRLCAHVRRAEDAARPLKALQRQMDRVGEAVMPREVELAGWYGVVERKEVVRLVERQHRKTGWSGCAFYKAVALLDRLHLVTRDKSTGNTSFSRGNIKLIALAALYVAAKVAENRSSIPPADAYLRHSELMGFTLRDFVAVEKVLLNHVAGVLHIPDALTSLRAAFTALLAPAATALDAEAEAAGAPTPTEPAMTPPVAACGASGSNHGDRSLPDIPELLVMPDAQHTQKIDGSATEGILPLDDDDTGGDPRGALHQRSVSLQLWTPDGLPQGLHQRSKSLLQDPVLPDVPALSVQRTRKRSLLTLPAGAAGRVSPTGSDRSAAVGERPLGRLASSSGGSGSGGSPASSKARLFVSYAPRRQKGAVALDAGCLTRTGLRVPIDQTVPLRSLLPRIAERFALNDTPPPLVPMGDAPASAVASSPALVLYELREHGIVVGAALDLDAPVASLTRGADGDVELLAMDAWDVAAGFAVMDRETGRGLPYLPNADLLQVAEQVLRQCSVESISCAAGDPVQLAAFSLVMGSLCTTAAPQATVRLIKHLAVAVETRVMVAYLRRYACVAAEFRYSEWTVPADFPQRLQNVFRSFFDGAEGYCLAGLAASGSADDMHDATSHVVSTPSPSSLSRSGGQGSIGPYYTPRSHSIDSPSASSVSFRHRSTTLSSTMSSTVGHGFIASANTGIRSMSTSSASAWAEPHLATSFAGGHLHSRASSVVSGHTPGDALSGPSFSGRVVSGGSLSARMGAPAVLVAATVPAPSVAVARRMEEPCCAREAHDAAVGLRERASVSPVPPPDLIISEGTRPRRGAVAPLRMKLRPQSADQSELAAMLAAGAAASEDRPASAPPIRGEGDDGDSPGSAPGAAPAAASRLSRYARSVVGQAGRLLKGRGKRNESSSGSS
eukprot:TRINITY_DN1653_c0_g1_i1.p1 TRINITY_DN1653_c0_g1~~TRINITY_DN1653_c0_g1_i1.p1  ORF type:complete len:912 (+),score=206.30 TRINITY_DN1653_c0_g1_i1:57-2792(+)